MPNAVTRMSDLIKFPAFKGLTLLAGEEGLGRGVATCGILEYQFSPEMKSRYYYTAFGEGMLVLTTFMYAVGNEYLISDAVRRLDALGVAGLVIKNVFHIRIPDSVIRFANVCKFPILLAEDTQDNAFENLVLAFHSAVEMRARADMQQRTAEELLHQDLDEAAVLRKTFQLYPSIGHHYRADYYLSKEPVDDETWAAVEDVIRSAPPPFKGSCRYQNGIFLFHTLDNTCWAEIVENRDPTILKVQALLPRCAVGISWIHHRLDGMKAALEEGLQAASILQGPGVMRYGEMGTYRILFGASGDYRMKEFSNDILQPIFDYDAGENGRLAQTLFGLVECGCNLHLLSKKLGQHENTLRQRLGRIASLTGLDFRKVDQYEQLSLAVKIHNCIEGRGKLPLN